MVKICPKCGIKADANAKFCKICGSKRQKEGQQLIKRRILSVNLERNIKKLWEDIKAALQTYRKRSLKRMSRMKEN